MSADEAVLKKFRQKTLVLIKPDALERGLAGEIIARFERVGLRIVDIKLVVPDDDLARKHYPVAENWFRSVGERSIADFAKYGLEPKEVVGTDDSVEIGKLIHGWNVEKFTGAQVVAMIIEGIHAVEAVRKLCGPTLPLLAPPGTIRGDYSSNSAASENSVQTAIKNLVHASGDEQEARREIELWFGFGKAD